MTILISIISISSSNFVIIMITGNLQKPLPRDVKLIIKESFFCGIAEGKPQVKILKVENEKTSHMLTRIILTMTMTMTTPA